MEILCEVQMVKKFTFISIKAHEGLCFFSLLGGAGIIHVYWNSSYSFVPIVPSFLDSTSDIGQLQIVLDLDETLVCSYETSTLPAVIRNQAIEAGLKFFELECFSSDEVFSFSGALYCFILLSFSLTIFPGYSPIFRTVKGSLRSTMLLSLSVRVCTIS